MADIFDEIAASVVGGEMPAAAPIAATIAAQPDMFDQVAAATFGKDPAGYNAETVSGQLGKGLTFGFMDEIQGLEYGAQQLIADMFGRGKGKSFWENYETKKQAEQAQDLAFEEANPYGAMGLQFLGAAAPGIGSMFTKAAVAAPSALKTAAQYLYGAGITKAPSVVQLAKMGAVGGGLAGAGSGDGGLDRLQKGVVGAGIGAVAAPVIGKTLETGANLLGDFISDTNLPARLASERGSVSGADDLTRYTPEELFLAKQLKNVPVEKVSSGADELTRAIDEGSPLFLPEAIDAAKINRNAKYIANYEPSMDYSQAAIKGRTEATTDRLTELFDAVSPERSTYVGASKMSEGATAILDDATTARLDAVNALYSKAREQTPVIQSPKIAELIDKDAYLQSAISDVKKFAENADLPDNSLQIIGQAKSILGDKIEAARRTGEGNKARLLKKTYNALNDAIGEEAPLYRQADEIYAKLSKGVDALEASKLTFLKGLDPDNINKIGEIFKLPAERITDLRKSFVDAGYQSEFEQGIRSYLQNIVDNAPAEKGGKALSKLISSTNQRKALKAALGDSYDSVINPLLREQKIYEGGVRFGSPGSTTEGNFAERAGLESIGGAINELKEGNYTAALFKLFKSEMPEDLAQEMAKIYFDPKRGKDAIQKILPLLENYAKTRDISKVIGATSGTATATTGQRIVNKSEAPIKNSEGIDSVFQKKKVDEPITDTMFKRTSMEKKPEIKAVEQEIDADPYYSALYEAESGRNPNAKNPNSSAAGGFQFIKATAKSMGLDDPYDLRASFDAVQRFTDDHRARFGDDPATLYAAHYMGATLLSKLNAGKQLTENEQKIVESFERQALPRFMRILEKVNKPKTTMV